MSWFLAFVGFAALVILHELGHFLAAKATGMRVEKFFLFFPPKLVSIKRGETEYGIGAIPAGGFVKITGMNPDEVLPPDIAHRGYYHQPVWKRIVVIAAGPAMNVLVAFLILFVLAFGVKEAVGTSLKVGSVQPASPAVGKLQPGDRILSVDGIAGKGDTFDARAEDLRERIQSHSCPGEPTDGCAAEIPVVMEVSRAGSEQTLRIKPRYDAASDRNLIGFSFEPGRVVPVDPTIPEAAVRSVEFMGTVTGATLTAISRLFDAEQRKQISGVVGSYEVTRQAIEFDARTALTLLAVISLSLAIINLFPFLPLDGGHIFWSLVEKVRGRPVSYRVMERAGVVGFALVLVLFVIGLTNDIGRLTGEGFNLR